MQNIDYARAAGLVFIIVATAHLIRALSGWDLVVNEFQIPLWFSWLVVVVIGGLGLVGLKGQK